MRSLERRYSPLEKTFWVFLIDLQILLRGGLIGISVAAPVGPVSILCLQRLLNKGYWHSLAVGLGNAIALAIYTVCALAMTAMTSFLLHQAVAIRILSGF